MLSYLVQLRPHLRESNVVDGKVFYIAEDGRHRSTSIAVGIVELPGPKVRELTENIVRDDLNVLKSGVLVRIEMGKVEKEQAVRAALMKKIKANEWVLDDNAEIVLYANMGRGPVQTVVYEAIDGKGGRKSARFAPYYSELSVKLNDTILWQSSSSTSAPAMIRGNDAQQQVDRYQKPNPRFFNEVEIPSEIIDPKYSRGFGVSVLGRRGIVVVSTTPPGRAANPMEEALREEEERRKQSEEQNNDDQDDQ